MNDPRKDSPLDRDDNARSEAPPLAGRYPADLETDIEVSSGRTLRLRPIRSDDAAKLIAFHSKLSFDSIYRRYFSMHPELSESEVRHFTELDYVDRLALV